MLSASDFFAQHVVTGVDRPADGGNIGSEEVQVLRKQPAHDLHHLPPINRAFSFRSTIAAHR